MKKKPSAKNKKSQTQLTEHVKELKKNTKRILASEPFRLLVEGTKDYAILMLDLHGNITTWNAGGERIIGYKPEDIIGKHFSIFYTQEARDKHHPEYELKVAIKKGRYEEEGWRVKKDGTRFWANVIVTPIYDKNAHLLGFGKVTRDLTERRKIETLKSEFVSAVSHELRTPLTSISGSLSLLLGGAVISPEKRKELLEIANTNCDRLRRLIDDILDFEKLEAGKMNFNFSPYNLGKLLDETVEINKLYAQKFGVKIDNQNKLADIIVNVDTDRLMQVLTNLISNAVKFSFGKNAVTINMSKHNSYVRVSVTNIGEGISQDFKDKIFERFSQQVSANTRAKGGTGLGLAISKSIIEKMGGSMHFTSQPNAETTFYFDLPLLPALKKAKSSMLQPAPGLKRVLICEDDEDQANYLNTVLQQAGYLTDVSYTAAEAKHFLASTEYYAMLLDLILPDMNGVELIKELRSASTNYKIPIIVVSIIAKEGKQKINGNAIEVVDWLDKPIDFNKLSSAFSNIQEKTNIKTPTILHVEDDNDIQKVITTLLGDRATITSLPTVKASKKLLTTKKFDLVILDLLLPDGNGMELLPLIAQKNIPVIVFAKGELDSKYAQNVKKILLKTGTSPKKLKETIYDMLQIK